MEIYVVLIDQIVVICQFFELGRVGQVLQVGSGQVITGRGLLCYTDQA